MTDNKITHKTQDQNAISFSVDGVNQKADYTWFRGDNCNFNPSKINMLDSDSIKNNILKGWLPDGPQISASTKITAFGSCFAEHISKWLTKKNTPS